MMNFTVVLVPDREVRVGPVPPALSRHGEGGGEAAEVSRDERKPGVGDEAW